MILYSILYYRVLAMVTVLSLGVSALLVYGSVCLLGPALGFTLTLAGIAGLIVAVGITADSFVVYFERLKDEVRDGRTMRTAVEVGWVRARRTILSADTVSLLAAVILYVVSIGDVRGFAFTLGPFHLAGRRGGLHVHQAVRHVAAAEEVLRHQQVQRTVGLRGRWGALRRALPREPGSDDRTGGPAGPGGGA